MKPFREFDLLLDGSYKNEENGMEFIYYNRKKNRQRKFTVNDGMKRSKII